MKKRFVVIPLMLVLLLASCDTSSNNSSSSGSNSSGSSSLESAKEDFNDVFFDSSTFIYDGGSHILSEVRGVPDNTNIVYTGREAYTDVGTYPATAKLTKEGYNDKTLNASLTISPADFSGLVYESITITYDGKEHINDVKLVGVLPPDTSTEETVTNAEGEQVTSAIEVGTYTYEVVITNKNYTQLTKSATLTIKAQKKDMPVFVSSDGKTYFSNGLHNSYLYSWDSADGLNLIDYSSPKEFNKYSSTEAIFIAGSAFLNSAKQIKNGDVNVLYTDGNIDDFVKYSESVYYYSSNSLKADKSGIYRVDSTDSDAEPIVTKVFTGKSDNLSIYGNSLYFSNGNDSKHLYRMNLSTNTISLVLNEKVHEYVIDGNRLYCTVNGLLNDYIGYVDLTDTSFELTKITDYAGEYLTIKNGYLYFNCTDLVAHIDSSIKGVWRINLSSLAKEHIFATEDVNGFDVDSLSTLVYIDTEDYHLYRYDIDSKAKVDLLADFVAPEEIPLNTGGKTISIGTKTYFLNMYAGKTLYVYDEVTKKSSQLTSNKIADFFFYDGIMYFNQVTMLTNNDLYTVNLSTGGEATKLSPNDVRNMVSDGTYIYATHYNFAGASGGISRMKLDGTDYVKFSECNGAKNLTIRDEKLYYINSSTGQDNGDIEFISLNSITSSSENLGGTNLSQDIKNVKQFAFDNDNIFYIYNGTIENSVRRTDFASLDAGIKLASSKTNPSEIILSGEYVYYYSYAATASSSAGFYRVRKTASGDGTQELILGYNNLYYASSLSISASGYLYFLNYIPKLVLGNAHFYQINLDTKAISEIN